MKTKSKKFFAWKEKFKQKKNRRGEVSFGRSAPKSYRRYYWKSHRESERQGLVVLMKGEEYFKFPFNHRHAASWDYW